jgi:hypothetical protein
MDIVMVEFLLGHGADRNVRDTKAGSTAATRSY